MHDLEYVTITATFSDGTKQRRTITADEMSWALREEIGDAFELPEAAGWAWAEGIGV